MTRDEIYDGLQHLSGIHPRIKVTAKLKPGTYTFTSTLYSEDGPIPNDKYSMTQRTGSIHLSKSMLLTGEFDSEEHESIHFTALDASDEKNAGKIAFIVNFRLPSAFTALTVDTVFYSTKGAEAVYDMQQWRSEWHFTESKAAEDYTKKDQQVLYEAIHFGDKEFEKKALELATQSFVENKAGRLTNRMMGSIKKKVDAMGVMNADRRFDKMELFSAELYLEFSESFLKEYDGKTNPGAFANTYLSRAQQRVTAQEEESPEGETRFRREIDGAIASLAKEGIAEPDAFLIYSALLEKYPSNKNITLTRVICALSRGFTKLEGGATALSGVIAMRKNDDSYFTRLFYEILQDNWENAPEYIKRLPERLRRPVKVLIVGNYRRNQKNLDNDYHPQILANLPDKTKLAIYKELYPEDTSIRTLEDIRELDHEFSIKSELIRGYLAKEPNYIEDEAEESDVVDDFFDFETWE